MQESIQSRIIFCLNLFIVTGEEGFLIHKNKSMSYTRTRETVVARLKEVGEGSNVGLHSLRASGATAAARAKVNNK